MPMLTLIAARMQARADADAPPIPQRMCQFYFS